MRYRDSGEIVIIWLWKYHQWHKISEFTAFVPILSAAFNITTFFPTVLVWPIWAWPHSNGFHFYAQTQNFLATISLASPAQKSKGSHFRLICCLTPQSLSNISRFNIPGYLWNKLLLILAQIWSLSSKLVSGQHGLKIPLTSRPAYCKRQYDHWNSRVQRYFYKWHTGLSAISQCVGGVRQRWSGGNRYSRD